MMHWPITNKPSLVVGAYGPPLFGRRLALSAQQVASHKHFMGLTGQGKSKSLVSMAVQLINQGIGVAVVDPHADLATDILQLLCDTGFYEDPRAYERVLYIDFSRKDRFLPFNVLRQPYPDHDIARHLVEVCTRAWTALADGSAPQFENILLSSALVLIQNRRSLTALPQLLSDKAYRDELLGRVDDPQVVDFFHTRFDRWGQGAAQMVESTLRRVFLLTFSPTLRYTLGQNDNRLNFRQHMDQGISVLYNLGGLDEETQRFLGCLLTVGYEVAALSRADLPEHRRRPYHLILDEFSMFSAQSEEALSRILSLARKYGLSLTMAHQTWSQVSQRLQGALQNCIEVCFKLGYDDAQWAAGRFFRHNPYDIKHQIADPALVDRTHPIFFQQNETKQLWAQALQDLGRREALVKLGERTAKVRTLTVPPAKCSPDALAAVVERYAELLLTAKAQVLREEQGQREVTAA